jgi:hypothetical protein
MEHLNKLLAIEDSRLAWVLWLGLQGLQIQLREALKTDSADSGNILCQELIKELDLLLESKDAINQKQISPDAIYEEVANQKVINKDVINKDVINKDVINKDVINKDVINKDAILPFGNAFSERVSTSLSTHEDVFEPVPGELKLKNIAYLFQTERELIQYLGKYEFYSTTDSDLWNEIQRLLLRIPEKLAQTWRNRTLQMCRSFGATVDHRVYKQLPFSRSEIIYPGITGSVQATGLCLSDRASISSQLVEPNTDGEINLLAGIVSTCIKFIHVDKSLHHALKSVDRFGIRSLDSEPERSKYATALVERFRRVQSTVNNPDPAVILRAILDLDEAIHSLVYLPPCDRYSWWGKLQSYSRRTLDTAVEKARQGGYQVQIRPLWGTYADIYSYSKDDLQLDIGGVPGEVSTCLRVYAKINDEVLPGRVLFRSS